MFEINDWEADIDSAGHVNIHQIEVDPPGTGPCSSINDCDDSGWEGQIEEGHPTTNWEYGVHFAFCLENANPEFSGRVLPIECEINAGGTEIHCGGVHDNEHDPAEEESHIGNHQIAPGVFAEFNVEGELNIGTDDEAMDPIDLMHEEA